MEERLADFFHFTGTYASRAYLHTHVGAVRPYCLDALDVRLLNFLGFVVRMAHLVPAELALAANFACTRHCYDPPYMKITAEMQAYLTIGRSYLQEESCSFSH